MPGRDITRLRNRAARVLILLLFVIWAGPHVVAPVRAQSGTGTQTSQSPSETKPATPSAAPDQKPQSKTDPNLNDQGIFVFKKDVDEVLLHATVQDDKGL